MWVQQQVESYRRRKAALPWLDAHCWIGVGPEGALRPVVTLDQTLQLMTRYGIGRAIVAHAAARDYDPTVGNGLLMEAIADRQSLWGAAVLAPDDATPDQFRARLRTLVEGKIRLVRIFPRMHNWSLAEWCAGPWLSVLEEMRMPLAVWHTEATWGEVAGLCQAHPQLPVIVEGPHRKLIYHNRQYYRLLERFGNFHLEIHNLVGYLGLDDMVRRFGSQRLIFGTCLPHQDPNVPMMLVTDGQLTAEDRQNIAHANVGRLMQGIGV